MKHALERDFASANSSAPVPPEQVDDPESKPATSVVGTGAPSPAWQPPTRSGLVRLGALLSVALAVVAILYAWRLPPFAGQFEQTDDAYVRGQTTVISPQVAGYVSQVEVKDFDTVEPGQVLVRIDDRIYAAKVEQAKANVQTQIANLHNSVQGQRSAEAGELAGDAGIFNDSWSPSFSNC